MREKTNFSLPLLINNLFSLHHRRDRAECGVKFQYIFSRSKIYLFELQKSNKARFTRFHAKNFLIQSVCKATTHTRLYLTEDKSALHGCTFCTGNRQQVDPLHVERIIATRTNYIFFSRFWLFIAAAMRKTSLKPRKNDINT